MVRYTMPTESPTESGSSDPRPADGAIAASLGDIRSTLAELAESAGREHERARHREKIIDLLHEENQRLRLGELQAALEPVRTALYRLHDLVRREAEREIIESAHVPELLTAIADEVAEALARTGVERMAVTDGEAFDPVRHRPAGTRDAGEGVPDGTVVTVQRAGFIRGGKVVRRAEVIVARTPVGGE
jgi:molecular chaperone GrpE